MPMAERNTPMLIPSKNVSQKVPVFTETITVPKNVIQKPAIQHIKQTNFFKGYFFMYMPRTVYPIDA